MWMLLRNRFLLGDWQGKEIEVEGEGVSKGVIFWELIDELAIGWDLIHGLRNGVGVGGQEKRGEET